MPAVQQTAAASMDTNPAHPGAALDGHPGNAAHHHRHARQTAFLRWRRRHALPPGTACYNCGAVLQGPWCHACGQLGEDFHRSTLHLVWEMLEGMFHADGRLWHTLPRLLVYPGALTRDYLAGKRASQVPPLRIFFIVLLLVFFVGEAITGLNNPSPIHLPADANAHMDKINVHIYRPWDDAISAWLRTHAALAVAHPEQLIAAMAGWAHDFAFLSLPIFAFILAGIFIFRRGYVLFDHMVFSMHSLSFLGLIIILTMLMAELWQGAPQGLLLLLIPIHQFFHLRGVYRTSIIGTLIRLGILATAASVAFAFIMVGLAFVGLAALHA
jgi:hypothetical protein